MYKEILKGEKNISVIGLGYVGLPLALEFSKHTRVYGFDIKQERIDLMKNKIDPSNELAAEAFEDCDIVFTSNPNDLKNCSFHIIAVPTPIDFHKLPDLRPILKASETVGKILKKGDYVVYESTVYPGCTEEDCVPILEKFSGLSYKKDFKVGFSPERINPGDKEHSLTKILKITSGCDDEAANNIANVYELIVKAGIHKASSIKVAEAAKIIENTQRDVNIALMNELSQIFNKMDINTFEVLEAAATKWNFLKFTPGLVGGHCIGVDPYYLLHKAKHLGHHAKLIGAGRAINDGMGSYVAGNTVKEIIAQDKEITKAKVLVLGISFKENVSDIRNTRVVDILGELDKFRVKYDVFDPFANFDEVKHEYGIELIKEPKEKYDAIIVAVNHSPFMQYNEKYFVSLLNNNGVIIDIKGSFKDKIKNITYWSL